MRCSCYYQRLPFLSKVPYYYKYYPLPRELMMRIFEHCINLSGAGPNQANSLANVCESWRQVILDSKDIWQRSRLILVSEAILTSSPIKELRNNHGFWAQVKIIKMDIEAIEKLIKLGVVFKFLDPYSGLELVKIDCMEESFDSVIIQPNPNWFKEQINERFHSIETMTIECRYDVEYPIYVEKKAFNLTVLELYYGHDEKPIQFDLLMKNTPNLIKFDYEGSLDIHNDILQYYRDNPQEYGWKKLERLSIKWRADCSDVIDFLSGGGDRLTHFKLSCIIMNDYNFLRSRKWQRRKLRELHLLKLADISINMPFIIEQWSHCLESLYLDVIFSQYNNIDISYLNAVSKSRTNKIIKEVKMNLAPDLSPDSDLFIMYEEVQTLCRTNKNLSG